MNVIYSAVDADRAEEGTYGYFSNALAPLKESLEKRKINLSVVYARLEVVLNEKFERRFCTNQGNFALFCPLGNSFEEKRF